MMLAKTTPTSPATRPSTANSMEKMVAMRARVAPSVLSTTTSRMRRYLVPAMLTGEDDDAGEDGERGEKLDDVDDLDDDGADGLERLGDVDDGDGGVGVVECALELGDLVGSTWTPPYQMTGRPARAAGGRMNSARE